jgi:hypothetical protein
MPKVFQGGPSLLKRASRRMTRRLSQKTRGAFEIRSAALSDSWAVPAEQAAWTFYSVPFHKRGAPIGLLRKPRLNGKAFNYSSSSVLCLGVPDSRSFLSSTVSFKNWFNLSTLRLETISPNSLMCISNPSRFLCTTVFFLFPCFFAMAVEVCKKGALLRRLQSNLQNKSQIMLGQAEKKTFTPSSCQNGPLPFSGAIP